MTKLSPNAELIADALFKHYNSDAKDTKSFDVFSNFPFSGDELMSYCKELENNSMVLIEYSDEDQMYLYIMPNLVSYKTNGTFITT